MNTEQKFLNNSFFKESKYGFRIAIDPQALKELKLVNGKYQIEAKKSKAGKWYMTEDTWTPDPTYQKKTLTIPSNFKPYTGNFQQGQDELWLKKAANPVVPIDEDPLPF